MAGDPGMIIRVDSKGFRTDSRERQIVKQPHPHFRVGRNATRTYS